MFGYVKSDIPNMYVKDTVLYKALYCGLCKGIGKTCGAKARFTLSYDLAFLSALLHNVMGKDVKIEKSHCVIHPITKRPIAEVDSLTERIAALNVILAYYKTEDAVTDKEGGKVARAVFKSSYKKAKKLEPEMDLIVKKRYGELRKLELSSCDSLDISADPFGSMMKDLAVVLAGEDYTEELGEVCYNLGKWVYLIDAIDDYDKDLKKKSFNVFINVYGCDSKMTLLEEKKEDLIGCLSPSLMRIGELSKDLKYKFNHDLCDNVLQRGLIAETKRIMENKKCKTSTKY